MDYDGLEDRRLIGLIAQGDEAALGALYDRYVRLVFSLVLHIVGGRAIAEEVTLDVFTQVWQKAASYREERGQVNTWLTSMARYRAIDRLRRRDARPEGHAVALDTAYVDGQSAHGNPEATTSDALQRQRVRQALAELPEEQQEVLALAYFGGYSQRQIAALLDLPLGTVKTRVRLAMDKLRFLLREEQVT
jgi:RNA polymerase sigma-70 factor (ECF subfamily)